jgi:hypothetical protein
MYQRKKNSHPFGQFHPTGGSKNSLFGIKRGIIVPDEKRRTWNTMARKRILYKLTDERIPAGLVGDILANAGFLDEFLDVRLSEKRKR